MKATQDQLADMLCEVCDYLVDEDGALPIEISDQVSQWHAAVCHRREERLRGDIEGARERLKAAGVSQEDLDLVGATVRLDE